MKWLAALVASLVSVAASAASWEEQRADLEFARGEFLPKSRAFGPAERRQAESFIDAALAKGVRLSDEAFLLATLRITAFARNAHEGVLGGGWMPATRLPIRMLWFPDALIVARAAAAQADLLGARVESLEGLTPAQLAGALRPYFGGNDAHLRWNALWLVELGGMLHAMGIAKSPDRVAMKLRFADGAVVERSLAFVPRSAAAAGAPPPRLWGGTPYESERRHGWASAIAGRPQPLYLREEDEFFRVARIPGDALYVQFRANSTADAMGRDIAAFVRQVRETLAAERPRHLVLDLRFDIGGDIDQTRELARDMAATVPGRIFVLTGPYTFSAGVVFAAAMKHDAGVRVSFVGEPAGDRLRFWSEGGNVCLPNTKYCLRASDGLWDLRRGCAGEAACYGDRLDARVDSLDPDIVAPLTSVDWLAGRDPAMEAVAALLRALDGLGVARHQLREP